MRADLAVARGDRVRLETPGGGYGDPFQRDPRRVLEDILDGYISREAAAQRYSVILRPAGPDRRSFEVDDAATRAARHGSMNIRTPPA